MQKVLRFSGLKGGSKDGWKILYPFFAFCAGYRQYADVSFTPLMLWLVASVSEHMKGIIGAVYCTNIACVLSNDLVETYRKGAFLFIARTFLVVTLTAPTVKQVLKRSRKRKFLWASNSIMNPHRLAQPLTFLGQIEETKTMRATSNILMFSNI